MWCSWVHVDIFPFVVLLCFYFVNAISYGLCCLIAKSCGNFVKLLCVIISSNMLTSSSLCDMASVFPLSVLVTISWFCFIFCLMSFIRFRSWDSNFNLVFVVFLLVYFVYL
jgi:hypothetical protein